MIEVANLTKRYGSVLAVDDLSFRAQPRRVTGFLGPNGAGKTTTLRVLVGLLRATSGEARVLGKQYVELERPAQRVGAILEANAFHPGRSGRNHLRTLARAAEVDEGRIDELLSLVDLTAAANRRVKGYSLGMKQRLALAGALLGGPDVLILDEPANGLDPQGIRWLRTLLRQLADGGATVLVSSHVLAEIAQLADDVVIIAKGRLITQAPVDEVVRGATHGTRARSPRRDALLEALRADGLDAERFGDDGVLVGSDSAQVGEIAARHGIVLHELTTQMATLEDVFLELTRGEEHPR